jgi:N-acetylglucosamine kinase-like BadF-type ATPase
MNHATHPTLTADSGSTKTVWRLTPADGSQPLFFTTQGLSPIHQSEDEIQRAIDTELLPKLLPYPSEGMTIEFYGSGCLPELCPTVERCLRRSFARAAAVTVDSDLMGAARALCGSSEGIACILGTGANSCLYDGHNITMHTPPMGYILGDEGSGADLGKRLLNLMYKGHLSAALRHDFEQQTGMGYADVIRRTYREPMAARFLASLSPFIHGHLDEPELMRMVGDSFRDFFRLHVAPYGRRDLPVAFVGSIAHNYKALLAEAAGEEGFVLGRVMRQPLG